MDPVFAVAHARVVGLDVHQAQVTACLRQTRPGKPTNVQSKVFSTMPEGLDALRVWVTKHEVTHVAMEGTGVYWMPVFNCLEATGVDLTLCNAHHIKQVPGRKTDQSDAAWIAQLLASGLLKKSFVPPRAIRELRELTRARVHHTETRSRTINTVHRLLEREGLKLCSVVSDLHGATSLAILQAIANGERDVDALAGLARGTLKKKRDALRAALAVPLSANSVALLRQHLASVALVDRQIAELDALIVEQTQPFQSRIEALTSVGGIGPVAAAAILAELGGDPSAFADAAHASAWAGLAPGQRESAGKRKRTGAREGNSYLKRILVQVAMSLGRMKAHDLGEWFRSKQFKLGFKKAAVATAHKVLVRIWTMWTKGETYAPPPPRPLTAQQVNRRIDRSIKNLKALGYDVELRPLNAA
jgi:transposase